MPRERVTGLIGPNGAGKTTLVNVLTGFQTPSAGRVTLDGAGDRRHGGRTSCAGSGLARTFQAGGCSRDLSVVDNLEVTGVGLGLTRRDAAPRAAAMLDWIGIGGSGRAAGRRAALHRRAAGRDRPRADAGAALPAARRAGGRHVGGRRRRSSPRSSAASSPRSAAACC